MITKIGGRMGGKLYHASSQQNLKSLDPSRNTSKHTAGFRAVTYASDDKTFVSAFTFPWIDPMGIKFGRVNMGAWTLTIPKKHLPLMDKPCSIYEVPAKDFTKVPGTMPEYTSDVEVPVLKETKYTSARKCMEAHGVVIKEIEQDTAWEKGRY